MFIVHVWSSITLQWVNDKCSLYMYDPRLLYSELTQIVAEVVADPTLPRTEDHPCPRCRHKESVFFQSQTNRAEEGMRLYYVCTSPNCGHRWTEWMNPVSSNKTSKFLLQTFRRSEIIDETLMRFALLDLSWLFLAMAPPSRDIFQREYLNQFMWKLKIETHFGWHDWWYCFVFTVKLDDMLIW